MKARFFIALIIAFAGLSVSRAVGYDISDIKAEPIIGVGTGVTHTIYMGGMYGDGDEGAVTAASVPYGTVPLTITRNYSNSNIEVTWDPAQYPGATIYCLKGDGSGKYTNTYTAATWPQAVTGTEYTLTAGKLVHANQVGRGDGEVYYKGLQSGITPAAIDPADNKPCIGKAQAVGKVNILINREASTPGRNLISVPFLSSSYLLKDVFGQGDGSGWSVGDIIQKKTEPSDVYLTAVYSDNKWTDLNSGSDPAFEADPRYGNWVITKSSKTITVSGMVAAKEVEIGIYSGGSTYTGKTFLGMYLPKSFGLSSAGLTQGPINNDLIQAKDGAVGYVYASAYFDAGSNTWKDLNSGTTTLPPLISVLTVPNSYVYVRTVKGPSFNWKRSFP